MTMQSMKTVNSVSGAAKPVPINYGLLILCLLIGAANLHLINGDSGTDLVFLPGAVAAGEWWRVLTFPFVHVSWYHLLLDAGAFLLLYKEIEDLPVHTRTLVLIMCGAFSLGAALLASTMITQLGLCGLSGIAHGLMAFAALRMVNDPELRTVGRWFFALVVSKAVYEALTGTVLLEFLYMGWCGSPIAACHAGGVLGGILAFTLISQPLRRDFVQQTVPV
ncbi:MAG: rhombosortase [Gammaproteobacteria bacterium]|nr:rhombosortase [Gammaproteobacteria bacterium]